MLKITSEELRKIQLVKLDLLCEVKRICEENGISYVIAAGTLLGAVRHGGFIPWDDDADIAMLRKDYEMFRKVCQNELSDSAYYFQDDVLTEGYRWGYGKFYRSDSVFQREYQEHMPYRQGISIDIFPLDGVPDFYPLRVLKNLECFIVRKLLWSKVGRIAEKGKVKRQIYRVLSNFSENKAKKAYHSLIKRAGTDSRYVRILLFPTANRTYGYKRSYYKESKEYTFEGISFPGIADAEGYLSFKYGNYMQYPSLEDRIKKQHPITKLKFPGEDNVRCEAGSSQGQQSPDLIC